MAGNQSQLDHMTAEKRETMPSDQREKLIGFIGCQMHGEILFALQDVQNQKLKTSVWYREVWNDEFLSWNSSLFDEIQEISLPLSAIWAPDIIINEFVDVERSPDLPYVYVNSSGTIRNYKPIQVVSACSLQTYAFPFDIQNCSLTFNSILHTVEDIDLGFLRNREDMENDKKAFLNDSEWQLLSVSSTYHIRQSSTGDFAQIQFN
ncbi:5-hydroxytryptamine receptor 3B-like, partial [Grammomys surdaster]|uniref:5-hydroxytryptamine receptor 3B-like n=1 Tax=Grammomys surdaster TaxID=491861 RepID=UPI00109F1801